MAIVQLVCHVVYMIYLMDYYSSYMDKRLKNISGERDNVRKELIEQISTNKKCHDIIRMSPSAFARLCELLWDTSCLRDNKNASIEEQVVKFLYIISHNVKNWSISFFFHRSGETISWHFHEVLWAIISLEDQFLVQPNGVEVPKQIINSQRFFPFFKVNIIDKFIVYVLYIDMQILTLLCGFLGLCRSNWWYSCASKSF